MLDASATDDNGVVEVRFSTPDRELCAVVVAPYRCSFTPTEAAVGRTTFVVVARDALAQTASALRVADIARIAPAGLTASTSPKRDRSLPHRS